MSRDEIYEDFKSYFDGNGFLAPGPCNAVPGVAGSDNGTMFLSEFMLILKGNGALIASDITSFTNLINSCMVNGVLSRVPIGQNDGQEEIDDYLAVLNACKTLGITSISRSMLLAMIKNLGFMNNVNPGKWTLDSFLLRFPQLIACMVSASFPSLLNPLHWMVRLLAFPFYFISAIIVLLGNYNDDDSDSNSRRLAWHLQYNVRNTSLLCFLASKVWYKRLLTDYTHGMNTVASIYYQPQGNNPYETWWCN